MIYATGGALFPGPAGERDLGPPGGAGCHSALDAGRLTMLYLERVRDAAQPARRQPPRRPRAEAGRRRRMLLTISAAQASR